MDLKEIEKALKSDNWTERYRVMTDAETLTLEQVEAGLIDENVRVRSSAARRVDFTPTEEQIERGLKDQYWQVRAEFALRADFLPSVEQEERGLTDEGVVRMVYEMRNEEWELKRQALTLREAYQEKGVSRKRGVL